MSRLDKIAQELQFQADLIWHDRNRMHEETEKAKLLEHLAKIIIESKNQEMK